MLNFAYGYGPFLRTTELAITVSKFLSQKTKQKFGIIVPLVYGKKQKQIMLEEFGVYLKKNPNNIVFDLKLGAILGNLFYGPKGYEESLVYYVKNLPQINHQLKTHFSKKIIVSTLNNKKIYLSKKDIALLISRAPRVDLPIRPAYHSSFAYPSEILTRACADKNIKFNKKILKLAAAHFQKIEQNHDLHLIAEPATFSYLKKRKPLYHGEITTPPNFLPPSKYPCQSIKKGIYVTITGIPGLERLFAEARKLKLTIYTNQTDKIKVSLPATPDIITCPQIVAHFARSGWGSVWCSLYAEKIFIAPRYDKDDDPEIYFNNLCLEKLGLGKIYTGQSLASLLKFSKIYKRHSQKIKKELIKKYKTLNGINYAAKKIVKNYLELRKMASNKKMTT